MSQEVISKMYPKGLRVVTRGIPSLIALSLLSLLVLSYFYDITNKLFAFYFNGGHQDTLFYGVLSAILVNIGLVFLCLVVVYLVRTFKSFEGPAFSRYSPNVFFNVFFKMTEQRPEIWRSKEFRSNKFAVFLAKYPYLPAAILLLSVFVLVLSSRVLIPGWVPSQFNFSGLHFMTIFLVPVVEEFAFRGILTPLFYRVSRSAWSVYFSALVFSLAHTVSSPSDLFLLHVGLALGPFLLAIFCEALLMLKAGLLSCILLHGAANATVVIISWGDARWFEWWSLFYL